MILRKISCCTLSSILLVFLGMPTKAFTKNEYIVPFNTCATMQDHFNTLKWRNKTIFEGFENRDYVHNSTYSGTSNICRGGYITEISPLGRLICYGYMLQAPVQRYDLPGFRHKASYYWNYGYDGDSIKSEHCRWKN
jgi:hypothetical protein